MGNIRAHNRAVEMGSDTMIEFRREKQRMTRAAGRIASKQRMKAMQELNDDIKRAEHAGHGTLSMVLKFNSLAELENEHKQRVGRQKELEK